MPLLLCIDTATEVCSVALFEGERMISLQEINEGNSHASALTGLIKTCLSEASVRMNDLDAVAISKGPGSYTGLRVGVSTAKGLCYTLGKPLIGVNTLLGLAVQFMTKNPGYKGLVCPMIDARRMEVYTALYDEHLRPVMNTEAKIIDASSFESELVNQSITFIGNGAAKCSSVIQNDHASFDLQIRNSASGLGRAAHSAFINRQFEDVAYFEPYYLKDFVGTTPRVKL